MHHCLPTLEVLQPDLDLTTLACTLTDDDELLDLLLHETPLDPADGACPCDSFPF